MVTRAKALTAGLIVVGIALMLFSVGLMGSNGVVEAAKELTISTVKLESLYHNASTGNLDLKVTATIKNPSNADVRLGNTKYFMSVNGVEASNVNGPDAMVIPARTSKTVTITATLNPNDNATREMLRNLFIIKEATIGVGMVAQAPVAWFGVLQYGRATVELSGNTTQEIGPILASLISGGHMMVAGSKNAFDVVSTAWYVNDHEVTEAQQGAEVTLKFRIRANSDLNGFKAMACIVRDKAHAFDIIDTCKGYVLNMRKGEEKELSLSFEVRDVSTNCRGFYLSAGKEGMGEIGESTIVEEYYAMPNKYPPRLKVKPVDMFLVVTGAGWYVNGQEVTKVKKNTNVEARVYLRAVANSHDVKVEVCVRADYKYVLDKNVACRTVRVSLDKGQTTTVSLTFKAEKHFLLRGYFIKVKISQWSSSTWEMGNHYPPRLKVS